MVKKGRNWTPLELETFCQILADPALNYAHTLETKALKKSANKEVFESIKNFSRFSIHCYFYFT